MKCLRKLWNIQSMEELMQENNMIISLQSEIHKNTLESIFIKLIYIKMNSQSTNFKKNQKIFLVYS